MDVAPGAAVAYVQDRAASALQDTLVHGSSPAEPHVNRGSARGAAALVAQDGFAGAVEDRTEVPRALSCDAGQREGPGEAAGRR